MKILIGTMPSDMNSTLSRYLLAVLVAAKQQKIEIDVLTHRGAEECLAEKVTFARFVPIDGMKRFFSFRNSVRSILVAGNYDAVYLNIENPYDCVICRESSRAGIKNIWIHAHASGDEEISVFHRIANFFGRAVIRNRATKMFASSRNAAKWVFGDRAISAEILPQPIPFDSYSYQSASGRKIREELNIPLNSTVLGFVGRFSQSKNNTFLLQVLDSLRRNGKDAYLLVLGQGKTDDFHRIASNLKIDSFVRAPGLRNDVSSCLSAMDVFLFPSKSEGLGIAAMEAQANGLPVFASEFVPSEIDISDRCHFLPMNADIWTRSVNGLHTMSRSPIWKKEAYHYNAPHCVDYLKEKLFTVFISDK